MKNIALIFTLLSTLLYSNELTIINTYKKALSIAKDNNKTVLFMTSIDGCPVCHYMKDIVFEREEVIEYLRENYVVVIRDAETQKYPKRFYTRDMPTFYFINPKNEKEIRLPKSGGSTPEKFLSVLKIAIEGKNEHNKFIPKAKEMEALKKVAIEKERKMREKMEKMETMEIEEMEIEKKMKNKLGTQI